MSIAVIALSLGAAAAAANVFGGLVLTGHNWSRGYLRYFMALGAGFMLGASLLEMAPESWRLAPAQAPLLLLAGYLLVHLAEHAIVPHFHFGEETHSDAFVHASVSYSVLLGLAVHTFFDGVAIGSGFLVSRWLGWVIFIAVFMHKIPEGFTMASVMLVAGKSNRVALSAASVLGAASLAGVMAILWFPLGLPRALPLAAGVTLYVAASDLIPEVNRDHSLATAACVFAGVAALAALRVVFPSP